MTEWLYQKCVLWNLSYETGCTVDIYKLGSVNTVYVFRLPHSHCDRSHFRDCFRTYCKHSLTCFTGILPWVTLLYTKSVLKWPTLHQITGLFYWTGCIKIMYWKKSRHIRPLSVDVSQWLFPSCLNFCKCIIILGI